MDFLPIDGYLLDGVPTKAEAIEHLLRERSADPRAAAFYRAFEAVGGRAADEAIIAVRIVVAGKSLTDEKVRRVRGLARLARTGQDADTSAIDATFAAAEGAIDDVRALRDEGSELAVAARSAYHAELSG